MTVLKFLIDECLSPELVDIAVQHGHPESTCVRNRGWCGLKDHELIERVVTEDFTLVTCNSVDFRGNGPGQLGGEHAKQDIHAGLVCLNSEVGLDLDLQLELFQVALRLLEGEEDLVNKALDVFHLESGQIEHQFFDIPEAHAATQDPLRPTGVPGTPSAGQSAEPTPRPSLRRL